MKLKFAAVITTFVSLGMLLGSCQTASPPKQTYHPEKATPSAQQEYLASKKLFDAKDFKRALPRLKKFVAANPNSELTANAYFMMGQVYTENQDLANAFTCYRNATQADTAVGAEAEIRAAKIALRLGKIDDAKVLIDAFGARSKVSAEQSLAIETLKLELLQKQNQNLASLEVLQQLAQSDPKNKANYNQQAIEIVENRLIIDDAKEVAEHSKYGDLQTPAKFRVGSYFFEQANFGRAKFYLADVAGGSSDYAERARAMVSAIDSRDRVDAKTIGLVVPLSGKRSAVGYKTLKGVQLGLGIYGHLPSNFKLAVMDSEMNPDLARKAVSKLVLEDNCIAIIGGVESKTAGAEAAKAQELGVPFIALSQKPGITEIGDSVFRNALTGAMLVQKLVDTAVNDMHMTRFAIMYPNDAYGVEYANLFWDQVRASGGTITAAQPYNPKDTDFTPYIQRLAGTYYTEDRAEEYKLRTKALDEKTTTKKIRNVEVQTYEKLLPPIVDFDAIFIPDTAQALTSIASYLPYYDVDDIYLLGTNIWNNPVLLTKPDLKKTLERSVFVDSFLTTDKTFQNSEFFSSYRQVFGEDPGIFEVQAYDSALILRQLLQGGASSRANVTAQLHSLKNFPGALGPLSISSNREIYRPVVDLRIQNGQIVHKQ